MDRLKQMSIGQLEQEIDQMYIELYEYARWGPREGKEKMYKGKLAIINEMKLILAEKEPEKHTCTECRGQGFIIRKPRWVDAAP